MSEGVPSPVTGRKNTIVECEIDVSGVVRLYAERFSIDVSHLMRDISVIKLCRCLDSGYRFYFPFTLAGDDHFYRHFGRYSWYYLPWKWEHQKSIDFIKDGDKVLEVGAAKGDYLIGLHRLRKVESAGLELNKMAVIEGNTKGANLIEESVEIHRKSHLGYYDVVCSYQVLEHIADVEGVINAMVDCLKPGGLMIVSVPNNNSFIRKVTLPARILNLPPHHMGLWDEYSLRKMEEFFSVKFVACLKEPLQAIHADTYQYTLVKGILFNSTVLVNIFWKLRIHLVVRPFVKMFSRRITGHSIMAVYRKDA